MQSGDKYILRVCIYCPELCNHDGRMQARPCIPVVKKPAVDLFKRQNHEEVTLRQLTAFLLFTEWKGDFTASSQGVQCSECEGELVVTTQRVLFFNEGPKNPVPLACMPIAVVDRVIKLVSLTFDGLPQS